MTSSGTFINSYICRNFNLECTFETNYFIAFLRHLAMEIAEEWRSVPEDAEEERRDALLKLVKETVSHNMKHNAEVEACDLLI